MADFDDDGFADLAIGLPGEDVGDRVDAGATVVLKRSASGLTRTDNRYITQATPRVPGTAKAGDRWGSAL